MFPTFQRNGFVLTLTTYKSRSKPDREGSHAGTLFCLVHAADGPARPCTVEGFCIHCHRQCHRVSGLYRPGARLDRLDRKARCLVSHSSMFGHQGTPFGVKMKQLIFSMEKNV